VVDDDNIVIVPQARIFFWRERREKKKRHKRREKIQRERENRTAFVRGGCPFTFGKPIIGQIF